MSAPRTRRGRRLRLGIDMDGVMCDFNSGWMRLHAEEFGSELRPEMVTGWNGLDKLGGFADMDAFWEWGRGRDDRPSIFRHLEPFPGALETMQRLAVAGHRIVVLTAKPDWAVPDALRWLADHEIPTREIHIAHAKHLVACDVYLDDSPIVLEALVDRRPKATVLRMVRPWNRPLPGARDVHDWNEVERAIHALG